MTNTGAPSSAASSMAMRLSVMRLRRSSAVGAENQPPRQRLETRSPALRISEDAFAALPLAGWVFEGDNLTVAVLAMLAALILFAHRKNLTEEFTALAVRRAPTPKPEPPKL